MTAFPLDILRLPGLSVLSLFDNQLTDVPSDISRLRFLQTLNLANDGEWLQAGGNVVGHIFLSLVAVWLGYSTAYLLWK